MTQGVELSTILTGLMLAGILWLVRSVTDLKQSVAVMRSLIGEDGRGGIVAEVKMLRQRSHDLSDQLHTTVGRIELLDLRISALEPGSKD